MRSPWQGFQDFASHADGIVDQWESLYVLVAHLAEFREQALKLLAELSKEVVKFALDVNEILVCAYFGLAMKYAKLHLLLACLLEGKGKLMFNAFCRAHIVAQGHEPKGREQMARYLCMYITPGHAIAMLQDDFARVSLRVADALVPLAMKILQFSDASFFKAEGNLSPIAPLRTQGAHRSSGDATSEEPEPLLAHLSEVKEWVLYGLLLCPEELGEAGATAEPSQRA